jgi:hypothetical protein
MLFINPSSSIKTPEQQQLKKEVFWRALAIGSILIFVATQTLQRLHVLNLKQDGLLSTFFLVLAILGILFLFYNRSTWLPFLEESVIPPTCFVERQPTDSTLTVSILAPVGCTHVIYWASESSNASIADDPTSAYAGFSNSGCVKVSNTGNAILPLRCPGQYKTFASGRTLPRHVHWRAIFKSGIIGRVVTEKVSCL